MLKIKTSLLKQELPIAWKKIRGCPLFFQVNGSLVGGFYLVESFSSSKKWNFVHFPNIFDV